MDFLDPVQNDLFDLLPNLFIEDGKLCGLMDIDCSKVQNSPALAACFHHVSANDHIIFPRYLENIVTTKLSNYSVLAQIIDTKDAQLPNITTFHLVKNNDHPETYISRVEKQLYLGMFRFYNEIYALDGCDVIDTREKLNNVFNTASYESIIQTLVLLQFEFTENVFFPIPLKCAGFIEDKYIAIPFYPEHNFIQDTEYLNARCITINESTINELYNKVDSPFQLYLYYTAQLIENTKNTSKKYFREHGF